MEHLKKYLILKQKFLLRFPIPNCAKNQFESFRHPNAVCFEILDYVAMIAERQKKLFTTLQEFVANDLTTKRVTKDMDNTKPVASKIPKEEESIPTSATALQYQQHLQQQYEQHQMLEYFQQQQQHRPETLRQHLQPIDSRNEGLITTEQKDDFLTQTEHAAVAPGTEYFVGDAYDADVDDTLVDVAVDDSVKRLSAHEVSLTKVQSEREHIYEVGFLVKKTMSFFELSLHFLFCLRNAKAFCQLANSFLFSTLISFFNLGL